MENNSQIKAINHFEGPALVLAGPGSGKTFTITQRIKKLITEREVDPSSILVLTFTKAAALEMQKRFTDLMPVAGRRVNIGTFHSIYFKILKAAYNLNGENIMKTEEKYEIIADIIKHFELEVDDEKEFIGDILSDISAVKGSSAFAHHEEIKHEPKADCTSQQFKRIFEAFEEKKISRKKVDFDDMLVMTADLFKGRPDVLNVWQEKFKFILIDEFQDINDIQYENIKAIAAPENNIFVVGDDDQSIYGFRGARPEIMFMFEKDFAGCKRILLDINYRSTPEIVNTSLKLIDHNKNRFSKKVGTINESGDAVDITSHTDKYKEADKIVEMIKVNNAAGKALRDMAVLFRTSAGASVLVQKLTDNNILFNFKDKSFNLFEHWIAKDIFSYIKIAGGDRSRKEFLRIINRPKRYISRDALSESSVDFGNLCKYYSDKDWMIEKIEQLEFDINTLSKMANPFAYLTFIRQGIGYDDFLREYAENHNIKEAELFGILDDIHESAKQFKTLKEWALYIRDYGRNLKTMEKEARDNDKDAINLMTMHGSKGLEFDTVFVPDVNEKNIPHEKAIFKEDIEEERRLLYVAMTRAKKHLHLMYVEDKKNKGGKKHHKSIFVDEIQK